MRWLHELARAAGDRRGDGDPEHRERRTTKSGPAARAHCSSTGNSSTATVPPPGRFIEPRVSVPRPRERPGDREAEAAARRTLAPRAAAVEALEHAARPPQAPGRGRGRGPRCGPSPHDYRHLAPGRRVVRAFSISTSSARSRSARRAPRGRRRRPCTSERRCRRASAAARQRSTARLGCVPQRRSALRAARGPPRGSSTSSSSTIAARRSTSAVPGVELRDHARGARPRRAPPRAATAVRSAGCAADARRRPRTRAGPSISALDAIRHLVERARSASAARSCLRRPREPTGRQPASRRAAPSRRRSGSAICRAISAAGEQAEQQHRASHERELGDRAAHGVLDGGDALGDPHGADRRASPEHRHRGREDILAEAAAGPLRLHAATAERRGDLGTVRSSWCRVWRCSRCRPRRGPASRRRSPAAHRRGARAGERP